jgi:WD40 repeat protein
MRAIVVTLTLSLAACSEAPMSPPVTATRVLEVSGLQPVVNAVGLSPDGSLVVVGDFDDDLIAREVPSGAERWKVRVRPRRERRRIDGVFFSPDGSLVVTTGHEAQTLEVWDAATGRSVAVLDIGMTRGAPSTPTSACWPSQGRAPSTW